MNWALMTVFVKVGLVILLLVVTAITENWDEFKWTIQSIKNEIIVEIKKLGFSRWFSFRGKH